MGGSEEDPTNIQVSGRLCLDIEELRVLRQWGKISQPLMGLAQATKGADKAKWGCTSCLVLGAGVSVGGGCCVLNPACCAAALIGGATAIENCHGACA